MNKICTDVDVLQMQWWKNSKFEISNFSSKIVTSSSACPINCLNVFVISPLSYIARFMHSFGSRSSLCHFFCAKNNEKQETKNKKMSFFFFGNSNANFQQESCVTITKNRYGNVAAAPEGQEYYCMVYILLHYYCMVWDASLALDSAGPRYAVTSR